MTEVRKDSKGRRLWSGESQEKDGRYKYRYTDTKGNRKTIYSWRLTDADSVPRGKRDDISLREKEKDITKALENGVDLSGGDVTVKDICEEYLSQKQNLKIRTKQCYSYVLGCLCDESFMYRKINTIKMVEAKEWFIYLRDSGRKTSTLHIAHNIMKSAFEMAVNEERVRINPMNFSINDIAPEHLKHRDALTPKQENQFLIFLKESGCYHKYYDAIYVMFKTGLRISEFCGLTVSDLDFSKSLINVNHQLFWYDGYGYIITSTKTSSGARIIPMSEEVKACLQDMIANRRDAPEKEVTDEDGKMYSGFLYVKSSGYPPKASDWNLYFRDAVRHYNKEHEESLPNITPHIARHTFCTNMINAGVPIEQVQYIMGHKNASTTLNVYTHVKYETLGNVMEKVCEI